MPTRLAGLLLFILSPGIISPASAQLGIDAAWDLNATFFAGAYFDPAISFEGQMARYLVQPELLDEPAHLRGTELTRLISAALERQDDLIRSLNLSFVDQDRGNPVAIYVSRAQHETVEFAQPETGVQFTQTTISITLSLDIFSDESVMANSRRLESIYTRMIVYEQPVRTEAPLSEAELAQWYHDALTNAVAALARGVLSELNWNRGVARAVFQVERFSLPDELPPLISSLIATAAETKGLSIDDTHTTRERELLEQECRNILHQFVVREMRTRGIDYIALIPPANAWTEGQVARLLSEQFDLLNNAPVLVEIDPSSMNGYTIRAALLRAIETTESETSVTATKVIGVQLAARIYRPGIDGAPDRHVPSGITDARAKTLVANGGEGYVMVRRARHGSTRLEVMGAIRRAAEQLAPQLVDLMEIAADEIN